MGPGCGFDSVSVYISCGHGMQNCRARGIFLMRASAPNLWQRHLEPVYAHGLLVDADQVARAHLSGCASDRIRARVFNDRD